MEYASSLPRILVATAIALVVAAPGSTVLAQEHGGRPPTAVRVGAVQQRTLQERRRITGDVRAVARARVGTIEEGRVDEVLVQEGDRIERGAPLAILDGRRTAVMLRQLEARREVAEAMTEVREAERSLAERDVASLESLESRGASNPKELSDKRSALEVAAARRHEAQRDVGFYAAQVDLLEMRLADKVIAAPFAGVVVAVGVERGEWVDTGAAIAEIVSTGRYEVWLDVPQRYAKSLLAQDATVLVQVEGVDQPSSPLPPQVIRLVDSRARTFPIYVSIDDETDSLAPGMSAVGWVPTGSEDTYLTVPRDAIMRNQGGAFVYAVRPSGPGNGVVAPVPLVVLFETPAGVAVRSEALKPGDLVVIEGNERLFPMTPVAYEPPAGAAPTDKEDA